MAVGAIGNKNMTFDEWLKAENKTDEVKTEKPQQAKTGELSETGLPMEIVQQLDKETSIFNFVSKTSTQETAGAGGVTMSGINPQPTAGIDSGSKSIDSAIQNDNNNSVLVSGATGHSAQTQAPVVASGLQATQGNQSTDKSDNATRSKQLNADLYSQYETAMKNIKEAEKGEEVSTGEGTLSTGDTKKTENAAGIDGTNNVNNPTAADSLTETPTAENTEKITDSASKNDEPAADLSGNNQKNIQKQEEQQQEKILDEKRFKKLEKERVA